MGDPTNIIYRSSWELRVLKWLDENDSVISYASEELHIDYFSPIDRKWHKYFPDFFVRTKTKTGEIKSTVIEIKPKIQTMPPAVPKRKSKYYGESVKTWIINQSKWAAAEEFCKDRKLDFKILTEEDLGII